MKECVEVLSFILNKRRRREMRKTLNIFWSTKRTNPLKYLRFIQGTDFFQQSLNLEPNDSISSNSVILYYNDLINK
jgi:hypothetical protein